jgi:hypothetical protein
MEHQEAGSRQIDTMFSAETSVGFRQATRCYILEDSFQVTISNMEMYRHLPRMNPSRTSREFAPYKPIGLGGVRRPRGRC